MISLDQILLLEQRVESAVAKIAQLQAENDALRSKCSELTNALSSKSEQLSTFESDQNKIESGILKALDRLNSIENSVLKATGQVSNSNPVQNLQNEQAQQINPQNAISAEQTQFSVDNSTQCNLFTRKKKSSRNKISKIFLNSQMLKMKTASSIFFDKNLWQKARFK